MYWPPLPPASSNVMLAGRPGQRGESARQERNEFDGVGVVVEQRDEVVALADRHRLHPAEDLHDAAHTRALRAVTAGSSAQTMKIEALRMLQTV